MSTNKFFDKGKLTIVMDGQFGSSGKGKIASYIATNADNWQFACNAFSAQAGHWVKLEDGREYFYQHLNSIAYDLERYEKMYIGPASAIELPALLSEIEKNGVTPDKLGISPIATIITEEDMEFERGTLGFDGSEPTDNKGTARFGSTCHGVGSATARKVLRRPSVICAMDVEQLQPYLCDVSAEIIERLENGQSGLLELAQGFPLSLNGRFYPYCTSRNVTVSQALSDMFLPTKYAGQVIINLRTLPIRINSKKFIGADGNHLTWGEVESGVPHTVFEGNSGDWYPDQSELTWDEVTQMGGSPEKIIEMTSVTKLPRRIATFSRQNLEEAIVYNDTGHGVHLSLNFANYIDYELTGKRSESDLTEKFKEWASENLGTRVNDIAFVGTGALTEDMIQL